GPAAAFLGEWRARQVGAGSRHWAVAGLRSLSLSSGGNPRRGWARGRGPPGGEKDALLEPGVSACFPAGAGEPRERFPQPEGKDRAHREGAGKKVLDRRKRIKRIERAHETTGRTKRNPFWEVTLIFRKASVLLALVCGVLVGLDLLGDEKEKEA